MEISTAAPPSLSLPTPKSPETDQADTPTPAPASARIQPTKSLPFTNGVHKRHPPQHLHHHHHTSPATRPPAVSYKECMKNHAATMGGHALDGCGEFMPSPAAVPTDPTSLKCAACGCHRNFHRRESPAADESHRQPHHHHQPHPLSAAPTTHVIEYHPHHRHHPPPPPPYNGRSPNSQSPPPISSSYYPSSAPHMLLALSGGAATGNGNGSALPSSDALHSPHGRKRFRTKFSQDQKEKMQKFAEKLGWKMQKASEEMVVEFCGDVGVERGVFKVWMHNNKNTFTKRDSNGAIRPGIGDTAANQTAAAAAAAAAANANDNNGSSGNSGSHGYSKNGDGTYGSSTSS